MSADAEPNTEPASEVEIRSAQVTALHLVIAIANDDIAESTRLLERAAERPRGISYVAAVAYEAARLAGQYLDKTADRETWQAGLMDAVAHLELLNDLDQI